MRGIIGGVLVLSGCGAMPERPIAQAGGKMPDLMAAPAASLSMKWAWRGPEIRFGNTIANVGDGPLHLWARIDGDHTAAFEDLLDGEGRTVATRPAGVFEYHPTHNHTHIDSVARYELRKDSSTGEIVRQASKVSYCMEDTLSLQQPPAPRLYPKCSPTLQGISPGWADVYGPEVPEQAMDLSGLPAGVYCLVTYVDPTQKFFDSNRANNVSWVRAYLDPERMQIQRMNQNVDLPLTWTGGGQFWRTFWR